MTPTYLRDPVGDRISIAPEPAAADRPVWFVGASWGTDDQTERFIADGVWENGYTDRYLALVRQIEPGDRIAIKAVYTRKTGLPFDAHGKPVSVMAIKATGTVVENPGDGRHLIVDWQAVTPPREWYFYTYLKTIWKVVPGSRAFADALIAFTFDGQPQDYDAFLKDPFWSGRYGGARAWLVRANPEGRPLIDRWLADGFVSLAATHLEELEPDVTKADVEAAVQEGYEHVEYPQRRALTDDYYAFLSVMAEGDTVIARHDDQAWVGRITGEPEFSDEAPRLRRTVDWMDNVIPTEALPSEAASLPVGPRLVVDLTVARDAIEALFDKETPVRTDADIVLARATDELAAGLNLPKAWLDEYIGLLESRRQVIVYGPPGTGKTYVARKIARHIAGEDGVSVVQFHPSYAYEDFFEGLRPYTTDANTVGYRVEPGPLRTLAATAVSDPTHPYVLIVDEINRADIAKVFGELYYLLEYRGDRVILQYSRDAFSLPKNLYIIGTMNTSDRSIALVDAAIRRRFPFIEMHPSEEPVRGLLGAYLAATGSDPYRARLLVELNRRLGEGKLREFQIGPSYLMRPDAQTDEGLARIWRYDILPLLEEQLYGTYTRDQVQAEFGLDTIRRGISPGDPDSAREPTSVEDGTDV